MARPHGLPAPWDAMVIAAGGTVEQLARALGVARLTIRRWAHGERTPSALEQRAINDWALARRCKRPFPLAA